MEFNNADFTKTNKSGKEIKTEEIYRDEKNIHKLLKGPSVYVITNVTDFTRIASPIVSGICDDRKSLQIIGHAGLNGEEMVKMRSAYENYASKGLISYKDIYSFVALQKIDHIFKQDAGFSGQNQEIKSEIENMTKLLGVRYRNALANGSLRDFFQWYKNDPAFRDNFEEYKKIMTDTSGVQNLVPLARKVYEKVMLMPKDYTHFRNITTGVPQKWGEAMMRCVNIDNYLQNGMDYRKIVTEIDFVNTMFHNSSLVSDDISDHRDGDRDMLAFTESFFNDDSPEIIMSQCDSSIRELFFRVNSGGQLQNSKHRRVQEIVDEDPTRYLKNLVSTTATVLASEPVASSVFVDSILVELIQHRGVEIARQYVDLISKSSEIVAFYLDDNVGENEKMKILIDRSMEKIEKFEKLEKYKKVKAKLIQIISQYRARLLGFVKK